MATSRDREERGRVQQPSNRRNRLPDLISVTMSDGSLVEINLTGANREEREDVARFLDAHTTVAMAPPAAHRESRERSPRLVSSSGPTLRVTSPDVQDRIGQLPSPPIASYGESASKGSSQDVVLGSHASVLKSTQKTAFGHVYSSKKRLLEVLPALHSYFSA